MKQITKILETVAQKRGIAMDALYEQVDIAIADAIYNAFYSGNREAMEFWGKLYCENGRICAEDVIFAICERIKTQNGGAS